MKILCWGYYERYAIGNISNNNDYDFNLKHFSYSLFDNSKTFELSKNDSTPYSKQKNKNLLNSQ